jgi:hypothetical protein
MSLFGFKCERFSSFIFIIASQYVQALGDFGGIKTPQKRQCCVAYMGVGQERQALQSLKRARPFPADWASPKAPTVGALAVLRGSDITI